MPHPVRPVQHQRSPPATWLHQLATIATALAPLPSAPSDFPPPLDEQGEAASPPESHPSEAPAPAHASIVDGSVPVTARAVTPTDDVTALFAAPPPVVSKKRKRNQLTADKKVDSALHAAEGVRAVVTIAAVKPLRFQVDPWHLKFEI